MVEFLADVTQHTRIQSEAVRLDLGQNHRQRQLHALVQFGKPAGGQLLGQQRLKPGDCGGGPARSHRGLIGLVQFEEILVGLSLRSDAFLERFRKALLHEDLERGAAPIRIEKIRGQHGVESGSCRRNANQTTL